MSVVLSFASFFFFNYPATTEIYTLSLHDALPICRNRLRACRMAWRITRAARGNEATPEKLPFSRGLPAYHQLRRDRKSTRLNSSHVRISYAVFCLKKKKK